MQVYFTCVFVFKKKDEQNSIACIVPFICQIASSLVKYYFQNDLHSHRLQYVLERFK